MNVQKKRYDRLKLTECKPEGWLYRQLEIQMNGLSGKLYDIWDSVGSYSGWLGGTGENWERGPYYLDGLLPLAYYLKDQERLDLCRRFIEWTLQSQDEEGNFGPFGSKGDYWSRFVMLKVLIQYEEITGDDSVLPFMERYFTYLSGAVEERPMEGWSSARVAELLYCIKCYCERKKETGDSGFVNKMKKQALDWSGLFENFPFTRPAAYYYHWDQLTKEGREHVDQMIQYHATHIVNVTMGLKYPALEYYFGGREELHEISRSAIEILKKYHGVVSGAVNGDEHLSGNSPTQGSELCSVVEYMFSLQSLLEIFGDFEFADMMERLAYNALPSTMSEDCMGHQYLQQANQVLVSKAKRNWFNNDDTSNMYGLEPHFGCCTANMHQGFPKFVESLWLKEGDDTLVSMVLAPNTVSVSLKGEQVVVSLKTDYPFKDSLVYEIVEAPRAEMKLKIRIPGWCQDARAEMINGRGEEDGTGGKTLKVDMAASVIEVWGHFGAGDKISVTYPMEIKYTSWYKNSIAVERGPLVYGLNIRENWSVYQECAGVKDYVITPESPWNYAIKKDGNVSVKENEISSIPFSKAQPPVRIEINGTRLPGWTMDCDSAGDIPPCPVSVSEKETMIELIPFGCTKLRVSQFPYYECDGAL